MSASPTGPSREPAASAKLCVAAVIAATACAPAGWMSGTTKLTSAIELTLTVWEYGIPADAASGYTVTLNLPRRPMSMSIDPSEPVVLTTTSLSFSSRTRTTRLAAAVPSGSVTLHRIACVSGP